MGKFLESCRQCYALIGVAFIAGVLGAVWGFGQAGALVLTWLGVLPWKWDDCSWHGGCSTEIYAGPESFVGFVLFGVVCLFWLVVMCWALLFVFDLLDELGRVVIKSGQRKFKREP